METTLVTILRDVQPGLTIAGLMITFAIVCLKLRGYFESKGTSFNETNLEKINRLYAAFTEAHIKPLLRSELVKTRRNAIEETLVACRNIIFNHNPSRRGDPYRIIANITDVTADVFRANSLENIDSDDVVDEYLEAKTGDTFLRSVNSKYEARENILRIFYSVKALYLCLEHAFLVLSLLLFAGLLIKYFKVTYIEGWWWFLILEIVVVSILMYIRLKVLETRIDRIWRYYNLHGTLQKIEIP